MESARRGEAEKQEEPVQPRDADGTTGGPWGTQGRRGPPATDPRETDMVEAARKAMGRSGAERGSTRNDQIPNGEEAHQKEKRPPQPA